MHKIAYINGDRFSLQDVKAAPETEGFKVDTYND